MIKSYIGIDLGTSSVKVVQYFENGDIKKAKEVYCKTSPEGFYNAVTVALKKLDLSTVCAVGLSSQVGTYIINERDVISWNESTGEKELKEIKEKYSLSTFVKEISMPHPDIVSYPIPRLKYIQKKYGDQADVCQPKDYIVKLFCGKYITDKFSWRGLANITENKYSEYFLNEVGNPKLPELSDVSERAGIICDEVSELVGFPTNIPVYTGINDYYSSLVGMGIFKTSSAFDITGTSEHFGVISDGIFESTPMISGPYIKNFVHYGVTASSGCSLQFGIDNFDLLSFDEIDTDVIKFAPVFTPYLKGERAPIFDINATGTFFGVTDKCTKKHFAYSVLEGVAFSIYHIYECMGCPPLKSITVSGGAAGNDLLNKIKATLFGVPLIIPAETDTSALGAVILAVAGEEKKSIEEISNRFFKIKSKIMPDAEKRLLLLERFEIYKKIYPALKKISGNFKEENK